MKNETIKVETYSMKSLSGNGRHVRMATRVIFENGTIVEFIEKLSKKEAIKQAHLLS